MTHNAGGPFRSRIARKLGSHHAGAGSRWSPRPGRVLAGVCAVLVVSATVGVSLALAGVPVPVWPAASAVALPANVNALPGADLGSVACTSVGNCVAVGSYNDQSNTMQAMVVGESGGVWGSASEVALPAHTPGTNASLDSVSCPSAGNCVAVGGYNDLSGYQQEMAVVESGGVWKTAVSPQLPVGAGANPRAFLTSVACASAGNCAAVGIYTDLSGTQQALTVVESAGAWAAATEVTLPGNAAANPHAYLGSIACPGAGSCVAVGNYDGTASSSEYPLLVVESGVAWGAGSPGLPSNAVTTPTEAYLNSVACASVGNCVTGGYYATSAGGQAFVVAEVGGTWGPGSAVTPPSNASSTHPDAYVKAVACPSVGNCAAVGPYRDTSAHTQALVAGQAGGGWGSASEVTLPANANSDPNADLNSVACASAGNCVAVGGYSDTSNESQAMVVAESGGAWGSASEVALPVSPAPADLNSVACASAVNCVAVGGYGGSLGNRPMVLGSVGSLGVGTSGLPAAVVGSAYSAQLSASGGAGSYSWSVTAGALPAGLSLNSGTGVISGTPTAVGTPSFTVAVKDPGPPGQQASAGLSIAVGGPRITKVKISAPTVTVTVSCGAAVGLTCTGTLALTTLEHLGGHTITAITATHKPRKPKKPKHKTRRITLATTSYTIAGATSKPLKITLNATARRLLAKYHKLPAKMTLTPSGSKTAAATISVTIKPSKPKPKHHHH